MTTYELWLLVLTVAIFVAAAVAALARDVRWLALSVAVFAVYLFSVVLHKITIMSTQVPENPEPTDPKLPQDPNTGSEQETGEQK